MFLKIYVFGRRILYVYVSIYAYCIRIFHLWDLFRKIIHPNNDRFIRPTPGCPNQFRFASLEQPLNTLGRTCTHAHLTHSRIIHLCIRIDPLISIAATTLIHLYIIRSWPTAMDDRQRALSTTLLSLHWVL